MKEHMSDEPTTDPGIEADGKRGGLEARLMIIGIAVITVIALLMVRVI